MKVSELTDTALDWAVAKCELIQHLTSLGKTPNYEQCDSIALSKIRLGMGYSTNWALGGPIIEQNGMHIDCLRKADHCRTAVWEAWPYSTGTKHIQQGQTPLIAAMRCYVASKLGDDIEIPEELL